MRSDSSTGWTIYALKDPRTDEIRYVGRTVNLRKRFGGHLALSQSTESHKSRWLRLLLSKGVRPVLVTLEVGNGDSGEAERRWISEFRAAGCNLTNRTDGGDGTPGCIPSEETRAKMGAIHRGIKHSPETLARMSEGLRRYWATNPELSPARLAVRKKIGTLNLGREYTKEERIALGRRSPEARQKLSEQARQMNLGRVLTEEHRSKISAGNKGKIQSEESRRKSSDNLKGKPLSAEHRAALSAAQLKRAPASADTRAKIAAKLRGRPVSESTRQKIAASVAKTWKPRFRPKYGGGS
jgi:hypothetical protein